MFEGIFDDEDLSYGQEIDSLVNILVEAEIVDDEAEEVEEEAEEAAEVEIN